MEPADPFTDQEEGSTPRMHHSALVLLVHCGIVCVCVCVPVHATLEDQNVFCYRSRDISGVFISVRLSWTPESRRPRTCTQTPFDLVKQLKVVGSELPVLSQLQLLVFK